MALPSSPNDRKEVYLSNIAGQGTALPSEPHDRYEAYLEYIAKNGGGGGTGEGDMTKAVYDDDLAVASAGGIKAYVTSAISDKVDKVQGKGLSSNDYDDSAKAIVDGVTTALDGKVSKSNTAGLLKNDGTVDTNTYAQTSALSGYIAKSNTAGLVKNDGTIDTTTTGAVSANTTAISNIKDGTSIDSFGDVETALGDKVSKSSTTGLLKNDGTVDTTITSAVSANTTAISNIKDGTSIDSFGDVETALAGKSDISIIAPAFSSSTAYTIGQYVTYEGKLYRFKNNHSAGAWNSDQVYEVTVGHDLEHKQNTTGFSGEDFIITTHGHTGQDYETMSVALNKADAPTLNDTKPITSGAVYNYAFPRSEQAVLGAKNFLKNTASGKTDQNVIYTVNADGSVSLSGTASANTTLDLNSYTGAELKKYGNLILSGGVSSNIYIALRKADWSVSLNDVGEGRLIDVSQLDNASTYYITLAIKSGTSTGITVYPMLRSASDPNTTFAPYAMTNKQLTDIANDSYANDLIGYIKTAVIKSANTTADQISAIEAFIGSDANYSVRNFVTANNSGQTNGTGMLYKYSNSYAGFFYTSYLTDKLIIGRLYDGTWSTREV